MKCDSVQNLFPNMTYINLSCRTAVIFHPKYKSIYQVVQPSSSTSGNWVRICSGTGFVQVMTYFIVNWPSRTHLMKLQSPIQTFSEIKYYLRVSSAKWKPFCFYLNVPLRSRGIKLRFKTCYGSAQVQICCVCMFEYQEMLYQWFIFIYLEVMYKTTRPQS